MTLEKLELYDLFRIRDCLVMLSEYNLADMELLAEVRRIIEDKV